MFTKVNPIKYVSFINNETKEHIGDIHIHLNDIIDLLPKERVTIKKSLMGYRVYISQEDLDIFLKECFMKGVTK